MNNKNKLALSLNFFLILIFVSCITTKEPQTTLPNKIAPNNSRISGTIVSVGMIDETSGPCAEHPCLAEVKINNVIGTGFGFKTPLIKGNIIKIKFEFTLSETSKELFPNLNKSFPRLKVGDKFIGDVERVELIKLSKNNTNYEYIIFNYNIID
ncbi:MAG: hypothetical protein L3J41_16705 [Melioribacteraceae bacterium]|nr:hypothetical protein [Melioribacteraceae bacterium]